jgi:putative ABC transport system permease protein
MLQLVCRQLLHRPLRTAFTLIAVAATIGAALVIQGFQTGIYWQLPGLVLNRGGDLIVTQAGITNMIAARSTLPQLARRRIEAIDGVKIAHPLTAISAIYDRHGRKTPIFILVYDTAGGPKNIIAGTAPKGSRGIVIDRSLARIHGLHLGERIEISEYAFRISGITSGNVAFFTPFAFVTYDGLIDFYMDSKVVGDITSFPLLSFLIVELKAGADRDKVAAAIEAGVPEADVFVPRRLATNDQKLGRAMLGPVFNLITAVSFVIGVLVIGLIMFASVNARRRSLGVLKALGFSTRQLSGSVLFEATVITALAFPFGVALAWAVAAIVDQAAPLYVVMFDDPAALLRTAFGCAVFALAGSLIPVRVIARLEPAIVFRR